MGLPTTEKIRFRIIPFGQTALKIVNRIMKKFVTSVKPAAGLDQRAETLNSVLKAWVPEIFEHPEQLKRIRYYVMQEQVSFRAAAKKQLNTDRLKHYLLTESPCLSSHKIDHLIIILQGVKVAMKSFDLQSEHDLDSLLQAHKSSFLSSLFGMPAEHQSSQESIPGENHAKT